MKPIDLERDRDLLLAFKLDTHLISYNTPDDYCPDSYFQRLQKRFAMYPEGQFFLASGDEILGQIGFYPEDGPEGRWGYIHMLYIVPDARGQGLGKYLLGKAIDHFRELGITTVALSVSSLNQKAKALYHSMGFEQAKFQDSSLAPKVLLIRKKE